MLYEDPDRAAAALEVAFEYMEWVWRDSAEQPFRPRKEDIRELLTDMRDSLEEDGGVHDFVTLEGLMVTRTDKGTLIYRLAPDREAAYAMAYGAHGGAPIFYE